VLLALTGVASSGNRGVVVAHGAMLLWPSRRSVIMLAPSRSGRRGDELAGSPWPSLRQCGLGFRLVGWSR